MDGIIKDANEIINEAAKKDRKEEALNCFGLGFAFAGLSMSIPDGESRVKTIDAMTDALINNLASKNFEVKGQPREFEAKFKLLVFESTIMPHDGLEGMKAFLSERFESDFWNKCIFDGAAT